MTVTLDELHARREALRALAATDDPEHFHVLYDDLLLDVLQAIATGDCKGASPEVFAALALDAGTFEPRRWYS